MKRREKRKRERKPRREHRKKERKEKKVRVKIRHPGSLKKFGYSLSKPEKERKRALRKAEKHYGKTETVRKLTALKTLDRNRKKDERKIDTDLNGVEGRGRS